MNSAEIKSHYKFSIAAENAQSDGYTTEKLLTSFLAHTVPIYWGDPCVAELFNPEAFINCNDYDNLDDLVKRVKEVDENDDLWLHMVTQPWQTDEQRRQAASDYARYQEFMTKIFTQPLDKAKRRPEGAWPRYYERKFFTSWYLGLLLEVFRRAFRKIAGMFSAKLPRTDIKDFFKD